MEQTVIYSLTIHKLLNLKQKILKLLQLYYAQETLLKNFSEDNTKKTGLNGYVYDFGVLYFSVDDFRLRCYCSCLYIRHSHSIMRMEKKNYPQVYLEEFKKEMKKSKMIKFIRAELESESESDLESDIDTE